MRGFPPHIHIIVKGGRPPSPAVLRRYAARREDAKMMLMQDKSERFAGSGRVRWATTKKG